MMMQEHTNHHGDHFLFHPVLHDAVLCSLYTVMAVILASVSGAKSCAEVAKETSYVLTKLCGKGLVT